MADECSVTFACLLGVEGIGVSSALFGVVRRQGGQELEDSKALLESWHTELVAIVGGMAVRPIPRCGRSMPRSRRLHA